ncbi:GatB/YqeY domain-containing protein [Rasiella sp. SM2506]|uniref:GatB/YqeY domain-containing protein n=1 Tax=Rasiella sp. SM2506 TaxID=3423914 RepID=UPI003D794D5A
MSLSTQIMDAMKIAMKAKDQQALQALRSVKSAILIAQTESGAKQELTDDEEIKLLQKLVKQRKDSAVLYSEQGRKDLSEPELAEAAVIEKFLPAQLSEQEVEKLVEEAIAQTGASSMGDMGKVMGIVSGKAAGRADGKTISTIVKQKLSN